MIACYANNNDYISHMFSFYQVFIGSNSVINYKYSSFKSQSFCFWIDYKWEYFYTYPSVEYQYKKIDMKLSHSMSYVYAYWTTKYYQRMVVCPHVYCTENIENSNFCDT